jgi:hypothetical protein
MPAADRGADQPERAESISRAIGLLVEALEILDDQSYRPDLGARLQGIIDDLQAGHGS